MGQKVYLNKHKKKENNAHLEERKNRKNEKNGLPTDNTAAAESQISFLPIYIFLNNAFFPSLSSTSFCLWSHWMEKGLKAD